MDSKTSAIQAGSKRTQSKLTFDHIEVRLHDLKAKQKELEKEILPTDT